MSAESFCSTDSDEDPDEVESDCGDTFRLADDKRPYSLHCEKTIGEVVKFMSQCQDVEGHRTRHMFTFIKEIWGVPRTTALGWQKAHEAGESRKAVGRKPLIDHSDLEVLDYCIDMLESKSYTYDRGMLREIVSSLTR